MQWYVCLYNTFCRGVAVILTCSISKLRPIMEAVMVQFWDRKSASQSRRTGKMVTRSFTTCQGTHDVIACQGTHDVTTCQGTHDVISCQGTRMTPLPVRERA